MRSIKYLAATATLFVLTVTGGKLAAQEPGQGMADDHAAPIAEISLSVTGNTMSAKIEGAALAAVLEEFSELTGVQVSMPESRAEGPVSADFENLSFAKGIKEIVGDNYTLAYGPCDETIHGPCDKTTKATLLTEIRILDSPAGDPQDYAENDGSEQYNLQELSERALDGTMDAADRVQALEDLSTRYGKQNAALQRVLELALRDKDERIRLTAIEVVRNKGLEMGGVGLIGISGFDESPDTGKTAPAEVADRSEPKADGFVTPAPTVVEPVEPPLFSDSDDFGGDEEENLVFEFEPDESQCLWLYKRPCN